MKELAKATIAGAVLGAGLALACEAQSSEAGADRSIARASFYDPELAGERTASGEIFDPNGFTAAHKTLPLGTRLTVCKDSCTSVRVNDRGPFAGGRDLDLSEAAAKEIGLDEEGVGLVSVSKVGGASSEAPKELPRTGGPGGAP